MVIKPQDTRRLTLMVQRLMDADALPLAEGNALLAEIAALARTLEEVAREGEAVVSVPAPQTDKTPAQTERFDASPHGQTQERVRQAPHDTAEPA